MTSNPTSLHIAKAIASGLVEYEGLRPIGKKVRHILCTPQLNAALFDRTQLPTPGLAALIGKFVAGHSLAVSQKRHEGKRRGGRGVDIELERLEGFDEIWVLCYRKPGAGFRIVGRFLERDILVLFHVKDKRDIGNNYGPVVADVMVDWARYFGSLPAHSGEWISGYLCGSHHDADEKKYIER